MNNDWLRLYFRAIATPAPGDTVTSCVAYLPCDSTLVVGDVYFTSLQADGQFARPVRETLVLQASVQTTVTPEPSTGCLMIAAGLLLGAVCWWIERRVSK